VIFKIKRYLPRSFLGRSILIIVTPLVVLQVVSTWIFYDRHWETVTRRLASSVAGDISSVIEQRKRFVGSENEKWILESAAATLAIDASFRKNEILPNKPTTKGSSILERRLIAALEERVRRPFRIEINALPRTVSIFVQLSDGILRINVHEERLFSSTTYIFIMWMVGTSLLLFAVATVFMRNQVRPIMRLTQAVDAFGKGRDVPNFKPEGATEIRTAAAAFNLMRDRVLRNIEQRTEMLAGVSHDLRTPLTRLKLQLAMLEDSDSYRSLQEDVTEMEKLVEEYLSFARGDSMERVERINLLLLLTDLTAKTPSTSASIDIVCAKDLFLDIRPVGFRRCLSNLINNAATYGDEITITAHQSGKAVIFLIDDNGPGIHQSDRERVFKPFTRLNAERPPDIGGTGLGLTIARDIILSHGGTIRIENSPLGGTRIRISLPT
jgi:two-component system osmolarity sensor histidine kinase EnvZ